MEQLGRGLLLRLPMGAAPSRICLATPTTPDRLRGAGFIATLRDRNYRRATRMIHPAAKFQFGRIVHEYARWIAINDDARSLAPGWWWGPAVALREISDPLPDAWSASLRLPAGASYADAARLLMAAMAGQTYQPWPETFPQRYRPFDTDGVAS